MICLEKQTAMQVKIDGVFIEEVYPCFPHGTARYAMTSSSALIARQANQAKVLPLERFSLAVGIERRKCVRLLMNNSFSQALKKKFILVARPSGGNVFVF